MKFDESTLDGWSNQGSKVQSAATYQSVKNVLESSSSPYYSRSFNVFLQGSYGNDTNIFADSDVDIVICLTSTYYDDLQWLDESEKSRYNADFTKASYNLSDFKTSVVDWLKQNFRSDVSVGKKAVFIKGNGSRRDVDVLICAEHRMYRSYSSTNTSNYHSGITFWTTDGTRIINFPKQHRDNLSSRNQAFHTRLKPLVRIAKNLRNRMQTDGVIADGRAPSYFLEGLLWNMPYGQYEYTHRATIDRFVQWLNGIDATEFTCANGIHYLVRSGFSTSWKPEDFAAYRQALQIYWT